MNNNRPAPYPGPRCWTHHKLYQRKQKARNRSQHLKAKYGITLGEYEQLFKAQGGKCAICRRATGKKRKLAVDHDHKTGVIRGLLCKNCNYRILGFLGDDIAALKRAIAYLEDPPAVKILGERKAPRDSDTRR